MIMNDFIKNVAECYENSSKASFRDVATEFDITLLKVRKVLVTAGVYVTDSRLIVCDIDGNMHIPKGESPKGKTKTRRILL